TVAWMNLWERRPSMAENSHPKEMEMRETFGRALVDLWREEPRIVVLDADLNTSSKTVLFKKAFPDRFFQIGIAEQNLFGVAAGLALEGYIPLPSTFAGFPARRALDQIAISICYPGLKVLIPGSYVGLPTSRAGASHNCIEDLAIMRSLRSEEHTSELQSHRDLHSFPTRRSSDLPGLKVLIPGSYVGLPTSRAGASHNCIEDLAIMRSLPNMRVADPGDNADL